MTNKTLLIVVLIIGLGLTGFGAYLTVESHKKTGMKPKVVKDLKGKTSGPILIAVGVLVTFYAGYCMKDHMGQTATSNFGFRFY